MGMRGAAGGGAATRAAGSTKVGVYGRWLARQASSTPWGGFAPHGWLGLVLVAVMWPLNWGLGIEGLRTHILFFPLWLGYALVVDALVLKLRGTSLVTRSARGFALLYLASMPGWWLFEVINWRTGNWSYSAREQFGNVEYFLYATLCFSTVMAAVFGSAELIRSIRPFERLRNGPSIGSVSAWVRVMPFVGLAALALVMIWPDRFYPLVWGIAFFLIEPLNARLGKPTLLEPLSRGDWRPFVALALGALLCGFFWEMWNYYSAPKWFYSTPGAEFWYVFEMPLLGYIGYLPFALELYALANLILPRPPALKL